MTAASTAWLVPKLGLSTSLPPVVLLLLLLLLLCCRCSTL
jgi:hypothetical protein